MWCQFIVIFLLQTITINPISGQSGSGKNGSCNISYYTKENWTEDIQSNIQQFPTLLNKRQFTLNEDILKHSSVLYGLIAAATNNEVSDVCFKQLQGVRKGIHDRNIWAIKGSLINAFLYQNE